VTDAEFAGSPGAQPANNGDGAPYEESAESRMASLEARLAAATAESERQRDEWLRAKAETDNVRRRGQEDVARAHRFGLESFAGALLAVKDSLDAALAVEDPSVDSLKEGVNSPRASSIRRSRSSRSRLFRRWAKSSIPTVTRRSARSRATPSPIPWRASCRRGISSTTGFCVRRS